jgi:hypothetical protein
MRNKNVKKGTTVSYQDRGERIRDLRRKESDHVTTIGVLERLLEAERTALKDTGAEIEELVRSQQEEEEA